MGGRVGRSERGGVNGCIFSGPTVQEDHERGCERHASSDTEAGGAQCRRGSSKSPTTQTHGEGSVEGLGTATYSGHKKYYC